MTRAKLALVMTAAFAAPGSAETLVDWQLLAIDGVVVDMPATLRIGTDGSLSGQAPCNGWSAANGATLPDLALGGIRATRMACDRLADEDAFFAVLALMTRLEQDGDRALVLTGAEGRSMEFVRDLTGAADLCMTCAPQD